MQVTHILKKIFGFIVGFTLITTLSYAKYEFNSFTGKLDIVGETKIGGTVTSGTEGSVLFLGAGGVLAQDNTNFFWNDTTNRLGIGTASPIATIDAWGEIDSGFVTSGSAWSVDSHSSNEVAGSGYANGVDVQYRFYPCTLVDNTYVIGPVDGLDDWVTIGGATGDIEITFAVTGSSGVLIERSLDLGSTWDYAYYATTSPWTDSNSEWTAVGSMTIATDYSSKTRLSYNDGSVNWGVYNPYHPTKLGSGGILAGTGTLYSGGLNLGNSIILKPVSNDFILRFNGGLTSGLVSSNSSNEVNLSANDTPLEGSRSVGYTGGTVKVSAISNGYISMLNAHVGEADALENWKMQLSNGNIFQNTREGATFIGYDTAQTTTGKLVVNGNVGIGTTTPSNKLHVYTTAAYGGIDVDGTNFPGYILKASGVQKGSLGLSTTPNAWIAGSVANDITIRSDGGNMLFSVNTGSSAAVYIKKNGGNVGIGTTAPDNKLHIESGSARINDTATLGTTIVTNGDFTTDTTGWTEASSTSISSVAGGQSGNCLQVTNVGTNYGYAYQTITVIPGARYYYSFYVKNGTGTPLFYLGTALGGSQYLAGLYDEAAWAQKTGSFTATTDTLYIRAGNRTNTDTATALIDTITIQEVQGGNIYASGILTGYGGTSGLRVLGNGNVGIGTLSPSVKLHAYVASSGISPYSSNNFVVESNTTNYISLLTPSSTECGIFFGQGSNTRGGIFSNVYYDMQFRNNGNNTRVTIYRDGNTGFGVTVPTAKIHIAAGTATASTAPLKFTTGTLLGTPEAGAIEFLTDGYYATTTTNSVRRMIVAGSTGRATGQTAANASVATYTLGATDATYEVSANVLVATSSAEAFTVTCAYTDEGNTARTVTLNFQLTAGTIGTAINFANGAVPYNGIPLHIRCKASTAITIATIGTFTGATYNVEGVLKQIS